MSISSCGPAAPTTLAIVALDDKGVPTYSFYTNGTADRSLAVSELPARLPDAVRVVHIGSYTTALEPTAASLEALVTRERPRRFISYDPNIRPSIVPDPELWRRRVAALTAQAHLVKASVEDIQFLYPGAPVESVLKDWLARGAGIAVATMGEVGAMAMTRQGVAARVSSALGQGHRHRWGGRHVPGGLADVAGRAWPPVAGRPRHALGGRSRIHF